MNEVYFSKARIEHKLYTVKNAVLLQGCHYDTLSVSQGMPHIYRVQPAGFTFSCHTYQNSKVAAAMIANIYILL